jgi:hypothetical protein
MGGWLMQFPCLWHGVWLVISAGEDASEDEEIGHVD